MGYYHRKRQQKFSSGRREDLNNLYVRSKWEANIARYLNLLIDIGAIHDWSYEPDTFIFHEIITGTRSYKPDFKVFETPDATPYYIEVKGWMDPKSRTKLRRMTQYYPDIEIWVVGKDEYQKIERRYKHRIPQWEH